MEIKYDESGIELELFREESIKFHQKKEPMHSLTWEGESQELNPKTGTKYWLFTGFCENIKSFFFLIFSEGLTLPGYKREKIADDCGEIIYFHNGDIVPSHVNLSRTGKSLLDKESYFSKDYGKHSKRLTISIPSITPEIKLDFLCETTTPEERRTCLDILDIIDDATKGKYSIDKVKELRTRLEAKVR